jgi:ABC-type Fe3+/spermidine/putrescine transport system ATPase subunit
MSHVKLRDISKTFDGQSHPAVDRVTLDVGEGEFLSLLGPSGCGKTTTLRMVAGLEKPTSGTLLIDDQTVYSTHNKIFIEPRHRNIGMVFQSYALWPHMSVRANLAYPLKRRKYNTGQIEDKISGALKMVQMSSYGERYPHELSGGQQQRISMARALIADPRVVLMDEPLSNLDAKLREELRDEIRNLQRKTGITVLYVTHDYVEAMALSDRIAVMYEGSIQQVDSPEGIYERPANHTVANIIGQANIVDVEIVRNDETRLEVRMLDFHDSPIITLSPQHGFTHTAGVFQALIRPEQISVSMTASELRGEVSQKTYQGERTEYWITVGKKTLRMKSSGQTGIRTGDDIKLCIGNMWLLHSQESGL